MKKGKPNRHDLEDMINAHAWKSPAYKQKLLTNPRAAFSELTGASLPSDVSIKVIEEGKNECVIVLHPLPSNAANMNEEKLRKVTGGVDWDECRKHWGENDVYTNPSEGG